MSYSPTNKNYLTVATARTNDGQKDIRIILDIQNNIFYSLDDNGNFNQITMDLTPEFSSLIVNGISTLNDDVSIDGNIILSSDIDLGTSSKITSQGSSAFIDLNVSPSTANLAIFDNGANMKLIMDSENDGFQLLDNISGNYIVMDGVGITVTPSTNEGFRYIRVILSTYADNAAAAAAGVPVDGLYKTATGEVRARVA
jgi:hypothetical protein